VDVYYEILQVCEMHTTKHAGS